MTRNVSALLNQTIKEPVEKNKTGTVVINIANKITIGVYILANFVMNFSV